MSLFRFSLVLFFSAPGCHHFFMPVYSRQIHCPIRATPIPSWAISTNPTHDSRPSAYADTLPGCFICLRDFAVCISPFFFFFLSLSHYSFQQKSVFPAFSLANDSMHHPPTWSLCFHPSISTPSTITMTFGFRRRWISFPPREQQP
nr:uncharacterized protein CTRU02_08935 [Colletotrichum truncatum]KAF6789143.1 hypothetical protein CTRU02_08935 [Colletotrichum truncatum]